MPTQKTSGKEAHKSHKKKNNKNIKLFLAYQAFIFLVFFLPVAILFLQKNGLSFTQIMIMQATFSISVVILEVPTGALADHIGRKRALYLSALFGAISSFIYFLSHNIYLFYLGIIIYSFTYTLYSGASPAFIYDSLKEQGREKEFLKVWGGVWTLGLIFAGIASVAGGFIAKYTSLRFPFLLSSITFFIAFLIALWFKEPEHFERNKERRYRKIIWDSLKFLFERKRLMYLTLLFGMIIAVSSITYWSYQPFLKLFNIDVRYYGILFAVFAGFAALGSFLAHQVVDKTNRVKSMALASLLPPIALIVMYFPFLLLVIPFMLLHDFAYGMTTPLFEDYVNRYAPSSKRATILSLQNFSVRILNAILSPIFGFLADSYSLRFAFLVFGIGMLIINSFLFVKFKGSDKVKVEE